MEFRDNILEKLNTLSETSVWILLGDSALLSNYAINTIKEHQKSKNKLQKSLSAISKNINNTIIKDLNTEQDEEDTNLTVCTLDEVWKKPNKTISGRWWCVANYDNMFKKDKTNLFNYIKNPCKTVTLVITVSDFRNIIEFKKNKTFINSQTCHTLNIQYPSRQWLLKIVYELFAEQHIKLIEEQANSFIMKMGSAYEEYKNCVDKVAYNLKTHLEISATELTEVSISDFKAASKGIEHFEINDLLQCMLRPLKSNAPLGGRRTVHKMLAHLLENATAKEICNKLKYRVRDMLAYRIAINSGIIPIKVPYNATQIQDKLEENELNNRIKKASTYAFKRNAYISSLTSLSDWFYIYSMLENIPIQATERDYFKVLLNIVNRTAISNDRLMNNIGVKNTLDEGLVTLNGIMCTSWWKSLDLS